MCPLSEEPIRLAATPIMLLAYFHRAVTEELEELRRDAAEMEVGVSGEAVREFSRKFEFFKLVYKCHSAAEDEVVFFSLDNRVKNVVCTYLLEHDSIDEMFNMVSYCLNALIEVEESTSTQFQELVFSIGTIKTTICQHMLKEETQIFPLLVQNFSSKEQASLIWQYFSAAPITLLQDMFPWLTTFLSPDEHREVLDCIKEVLREEELLQKVVIQWLCKSEVFSSSVSTENKKGAQIPDLLTTTEDTVSASGSIYGEKQLVIKTIDHKALRHISSESLHKWNNVIRKEFHGILNSLALTRSSKDFSTFDSVIVQLRFFTDVLTFFSSAYALIPMLEEPGYVSSFHIRKIFQVENQTKSLQRLMCSKTQTLPFNDFVENLASELELFSIGINEYLALLEQEVFPLIITNFQDKFRQWLLYLILCILPLGLVKCVITCFSSHLSGNECKSILNGLKIENPPAKNYTSEFLLYEWVRMGNSGKSSADKCIKTLQEMYMSRNFFLTNHVTENDASFSLHMNIQHTHCFTNEKLELQSNDVASYSRTINHIFTPQKLNLPKSFRNIHSVTSNASSIFDLERNPVDHLFYFHKALRKELENLVTLSMELGEDEDEESLNIFLRRFQLIRFLYQIHSDSEDEIAFPALEAKGKNVNISQSYVMDHKLEVDLFDKISLLLEEISTAQRTLKQTTINHRELCLELHGMCKSMRKIVCDHVDREETELWPLFRECLTIKEQEKIIGSMLGRMNAEVLQEMIPWIMASLALDEKKAMMSLWHNATKNTMFNEWLGEWWEEMKVDNVPMVEEKPNNIPSSRKELLEVLSTFLTNNVFDGRYRTENINSDKLSQVHMENIEKAIRGEGNNDHHIANSSKFREVNKTKGKELVDFSTQVSIPSKNIQVCEGLESKHQEIIHTLSQEELETAIRKISSDPTLDSQKKSFFIQSLLTSRWVNSQQKFHTELSDNKEVPGQSPSYRDQSKSIYGCKHYKRNCKLVAACCDRLYTCRLCHDDVNNHTMDRKATVNMMCMKCLMIQSVGPTCSTPTCQNLSMAKYYCKICNMFDDERKIYHCPYCNLCRVGKGLGIDFFHCMNCNACMSRSLLVHPCREKCFEDNCPICHEFIFTSSSPVKALSCGHLMHSTCFQDYTFSHYTCPICSKSLGDMQVYFGMLDALLAEEKVPDEYSGQTQKILCNDCEKRGTASFHWLYHKCPFCGSYNTRLL